MRQTKPGAELEAQFDQLQRKLVPLWKSIQSFNQDPQTIVVVPSMSIELAGAGAVVPMGPKGFIRESAKFFPRPATDSEIETSLTALAQGGNK